MKVLPLLPGSLLKEKLNALLCFSLQQAAEVLTDTLKHETESTPKGGQMGAGGSKHLATSLAYDCTIFLATLLPTPQFSSVQSLSHV